MLPGLFAGRIRNATDYKYALIGISSGSQKIYFSKNLLGWEEATGISDSQIRSIGFFNGKWRLESYSTSGDINVNFSSATKSNPEFTVDETLTITHDGFTGPAITMTHPNASYMMYSIAKESEAYGEWYRSSDGINFEQVTDSTSFPLGNKWLFNSGTYVFGRSTIGDGVAGICYTTDYGTTWSENTAGITDGDTTISGLGTNGTNYVLIGGGGAVQTRVIKKSTDLTSWSNISLTGGSTSIPISVGYHDGYWYICQGNSDGSVYSLYRSSDLSSWTTLTYPWTTSEEINSIISTPKGVVFIGDNIANGEFVYSTDNGSNYITIDHDLPTNLTDLVNRNTQTLYRGN